MENTEIPASVRRIESYAFRNCKNLSRVVFAEDSQLEEVCTGAFAVVRVAFEQIQFPPGALVSPSAFEDK